MERILVVDDERALRLAVSEVLERSGFAVTAVDSGTAALAALAEGGFALVISDMRMPIMTGAELLAAVQERHPGLPMVMMTAYGTVEDAVAAMKAGARDFLTKPFAPPDLVHLVRNVLADPADTFATLTEFEHHAEEYRLEAELHVGAEGLRIHRRLRP